MTHIQSWLIFVVPISVALGFMVFAHEWGHFVAAKLCGVRVDVFSLGFGPRLFGVKRGDTDYRFSALPLGGYVRMAGDNPLEERTHAPYEFLSRPRWQRVIIAVAGPTMNIVLAFLIYWGIIWTVGLPSSVDLREPAQVAAVPQNSPANGVRTGDRILKINGVATPTWNDVLSAVERGKPGDSLSLMVLRDGKQLTWTAPVPPKPEFFKATGYPLVPAIADEVGMGFPAEKAGLKPGDTFVSIDGKPVVTWWQLVDEVHNSNGETIHFVVRRDGYDVPLAITPTRGVDGEGRQVWQIGVLPKERDDYERQGFLQSAVSGGAATLSRAGQIADALVGLFSGRVSIRGLAGPVGIVRLSGEAAKRGPMTFFELMAVLSLNLGLLNLLPIPILDGGHVLMLAIEGTMRRDLSIAFKERFVQVGLVFLLGIFAFVMYSDILKVIQSH
jgi:regulator of sigma E protease